MFFRRAIGYRPIQIAIVTSFVMTACSTPPPRGSKSVNFVQNKDSKSKINETQLQDDLFRFGNRFSADIKDSLTASENSPNAKIRHQALLRRLTYNSGALDIILGPSPEANLLDMVVFVELSKNVWSDFWKPQVFKELGAPMERSFVDASQEIWSIASKVLNDGQKAHLANLIRKWRELNPKNINIENVRFSEFSNEVGARSAEMESEIGGVGAAIQGATSVGDQALLLSERALFFAQRAPFLWRLHARAALLDAVGDSTDLLRSSESFLQQEPQMRALLGELNQTLSAATQLMALVSEHPDAMTNASGALKRLTDVLRELNQASRSNGVRSQLAGVSASIDTGADRFLWKVFVLGCALIVFMAAALLGSRFVWWWMQGQLESRRGRKEESKGHRAA